MIPFFTSPKDMGKQREIIWFSVHLVLLQSYETSVGQASFRLPAWFLDAAEGGYSWTIQFKIFRIQAAFNSSHCRRDWIQQRIQKKVMFSLDHALVKEFQCGQETA